MKNPAADIEIRRAAPTDAKLVSLLGAVTFYEAYFEQDEPLDLANYIHESFELNRIISEIDDKTAEFFIIYLNGHAVGYAKMRENSKIECIKAENPVELQRIYLVERVFGRGIGERLLEFCLENARQKGFKTLWLGVWEENLRAVRFYEKHGFKAVGKITFPYGETVGTNLVMEIDL